jgi:hypothetical protein
MPSHLLLALLLGSNSLFNFQGYTVSIIISITHTRRKTLSDLVCLIRIINGEGIHKSTAADLEFSLL